MFKFFLVIIVALQIFLKDKHCKLIKIYLLCQKVRATASQPFG